MIPVSFCSRVSRSRSGDIHIAFRVVVVVIVAIVLVILLPVRRLIPLVDRILIVVVAVFGVSVIVLVIMVTVGFNCLSFEEVVQILSDFGNQVNETSGEQDTTAEKHQDFDDVVVVEPGFPLLVVAGDGEDGVLLSFAPEFEEDGRKCTDDYGGGEESESRQDSDGGDGHGVVCWMSGGEVLVQEVSQSFKWNSVSGLSAGDGNSRLILFTFFSSLIRCQSSHTHSPFSCIFVQRFSPHRLST